MRSDHDQIPPELRDALDDAPARMERVTSMWRALGSIRSPESVVPSTSDAWESLAGRIDASEKADTSERIHHAADRVARRPARPLRRALAAGGVVLALMLAAVWWRQPISVRVVPGAQAVVQLPDGSTVELNSASQLQYRRDFSVLPLIDAAQRTVHLRGEAFFSVVTDPDRSFVVETEGARVEVMGTQFNVRSRESARGFRTLVTLREGRVRVSAVGAAAEPLLMDSVGASVLLRAGELPEYVVREATLDHLLAWRTKGFAAVDEPVGEILREVQRRYSVQLDLEEGLATDSAMTVFYLRGTSAEEIIHDLCLSRGWQYRETSNGFAVFASAGRTAPAGASFEE